MKNKTERMKSKHIQQLREKMGLSVMDTQWLFGSMTRKWDPDERVELSDPSFSIMVRYLIKYPDENPLPATPEIHEIETMLDMYWDRDTNQKFNVKRLGPLFGCTPLAGYKWRKDAIPIQTIRHIMLLVSNAIKKEGRMGLDKYIAVVKEEATSRGISAEELWRDGWTPFTRRKNASEMDAGESDGVGDRILARHVHQLRERMGISLIDMQWIQGSMTRRAKNDEIAEISDPSFSILIRYLTKYPDENPLPELPDIHEIETMLSMYWDENVNQRYRIKRIGPLFGCDPLAGYKWIKEIMPVQAIRHTMLLLSNAIKKDGQLGLAKFISVVEDEASSRDIEMKEVWREGWKPYKRRKEAAEKAQKEAEEAKKAA